MFKDMLYIHVFSGISDEHLATLRAIAPTLAIHTSIFEDGGESTDTDTASEGGESLPEPLTALYDPTAVDLSAQDLEEKCERIFQSLPNYFTKEQLESLEEATRQQAQCPTWFVHRAGRITASLFFNCCKMKTFSTSIINSIMKYNDENLNVPSVSWGMENEANAKESYQLPYKSVHTNLSMSESGLEVRHDFPYFGASPDGVIECECCGKGIVEIKCPYKYRNGLTNAYTDPSFCLDNSKNLKESHPYYYQIQFQMFICNVQFCDLCIWTLPEVHIVRVERNSTFLDSEIPLCTAIFRQHILPEIVTRSNDPKVLIEKRCSSCSFPLYGKVIKCTLETCQKLYHYKCVHLKRARKNWFCCK